MSQTRKLKWGSTSLIVGAVAVVAGLLVYIGNVTGVSPTIPYAGGVTMALGWVAISAGSGLLREKPVPKSQKRNSVVVVALALLLFAPLLVSSLFLFAGNFSEPTSPQRWLLSALFMFFALFVVTVLARDVAQRLARRFARTKHHA